MFKQTYRQPDPNKATCPECGASRFRFHSTKLVCTNCDYSIGRGGNKFGAVKTVANDGLKRDSKFEATIADDLQLRKRAGDIKDYDSQYKATMPIYNQHGRKVHEVSHRIDFRIHHNDGSYELYEAKGKETTDWRFRRKLLEKLWLPEHPDHIYTVVKQGRR